MRFKILLLTLLVVTTCGAGPFGGRFAGRNNYSPQIYPSVNGPGPGVIPSQSSAENEPENTPTAQIFFQGPDGMTITWDISTIGAFDSEPITTEGIQNFATGQEYRLKLANLPQRKGLDGGPLCLYPTLQVNSITPRTRSYLEHNAIPVKFTDNDIDQVQSGNFLTKVIFLPSPEFQNIAVAGGVDTIVNTQLPAGTDPIVEAQNRGAILAVIQIGNKDLGVSNDYSANYASEKSAANEVPQIPISGVNVPAYGTPNSVTPYGVPGPAVLPAAPEAQRNRRLFSPLSPMPSTEVPQYQKSWSGINF